MELRLPDFLLHSCNPPVACFRHSRSSMLHHTDLLLHSPRSTENAMFPSECSPNRRSFLKLGAALATGVSGLTIFSEPAFSEPAVPQQSDAWVIGPRAGFSPEIGTLVSMMAFTRMQVLHNVQGMS